MPAPGWKDFQKLLVGIDRILMQDWYPIMVKDEPRAYDEYTMYCLEVHEIAKATGSVEAVAEHLLRIEQDRMGMDGRPVESVLPAAQKIVKLVCDGDSPTVMD